MNYNEEAIIKAAKESIKDSQRRYIEALGKANVDVSIMDHIQYLYDYIAILETKIATKAK